MEKAPPEPVVSSIAAALHDVKQSKGTLSAGEQAGKEPLIPADVDRIIACTPEGLPSKAAEAALWNFALNTGARGLTCENMTVGDIIDVRASGDHPGSLLVTVNLRVTKGKPNWNQHVTVEGSPSSKSNNLNVVYWLNEHLKSKFGLDLTRFNSWRGKLSNETANARIWTWSRDSMREFIKSRSVSAGYPEGLFGFHSFRSGFISSALIKCGSNGEHLRAALELCAVVGDWKPFQRAQMGYVKRSTIKTIVSTRLVMPNEDGQSVNFFDPALTDPEAYHGIQLAEPTWNKDTNFRAFKQDVDRRFYNETLSNDDNSSLNAKCWRNACHAFVKRRPHLEKKASKLCESNPNWINSLSRWTVERNARSKVGREYFANALNEDFSRLSELVEEFVGYVRDDIDLVNPLRRNNYPKRDSVSMNVLNQAKRYTTGHRRRVPWTLDQDTALVRLKLKYSSQRPTPWRKIAPKIALRTNVDCKDRWRNLMIIHGGDAQAVFSMYASAQTVAVDSTDDDDESAEEEIVDVEMIDVSLF